MVAIVIVVAAATPGAHPWLWIFLFLAAVAWFVDRRRREQARVEQVDKD